MPAIDQHCMMTNFFYMNHSTVGLSRCDNLRKICDTYPLCCYKLKFLTNLVVVCVVFTHEENKEKFFFCMKFVNKFKVTIFLAFHLSFIFTSNDAKLFFFYVN